MRSRKRDNITLSKEMDFLDLPLKSYMYFGEKKNDGLRSEVLVLCCFLFCFFVSWCFFVSVSWHLHHC